MISFIVPVFNEEKYLPKLLDSLVRQKRLPDEVIMCDNGSSDRSIAIAQMYADKLPIKLEYQTVKGIIPTVEKAWRKSMGDIIVKSDADSILPSGYLDHIEHYFNNHPSTVAVTGPIYNADKGLLISALFVFGCTLGNYAIKLFRGYPLTVGGNSAFRRRILEEIDGYNTEKKTVDDQLICSKIHEANGRIDFVFNVYNYHSSRRWQGNPKAIIQSLVSIFLPQYYQEKTS